MPENFPHVPNHIPRKERIRSLFFGFTLLIVGTVCMLLDDFVVIVPRSLNTVHIHGFAAWLMYAAYICGAANFLSVVIDHYDKRKNELRYYEFAVYSRIVGWTLLILAAVIGAFTSAI